MLTYRVSNRLKAHGIQKCFQISKHSAGSLSLRCKKISAASDPSDSENAHTATNLIRLANNARTNLRALTIRMIIVFSEEDRLPRNGGIMGE